LGIARAVIDMSLESDQSFAQVDKEATSSPKRFALCMVEAKVHGLETE